MVEFVGRFKSGVRGRRGRHPPKHYIDLWLLAAEYSMDVTQEVVT